MGMGTGMTGMRTKMGTVMTMMMGTGWDDNDHHDHHHGDDNHGDVMGQQADGDVMMGNKGPGQGDGNNDNDDADGDVDDDNHHHQPPTTTRAQ